MGMMYTLAGFHGYVGGLSNTNALLRTNARCIFVSKPKNVYYRSFTTSMDAGATAATAASANAVDDVGKPISTSNVSDEALGGETLAQYVVIRKDLVDTLKWPLGSVLAQACHAAVAAVWLYRDHPHTVDYCGNLDSMTTVTLEVKGETQLNNLAEKLRDNNISFKLWIEQPENYATCLATKPYPKSEVAHYFKKLRLCK